MCITGEAGGFRDYFGGEKKKEKKISSTRCDVPASECLNVSTSGQ